MAATLVDYFKAHLVRFYGKIDKSLPVRKLKWTNPNAKARNRRATTTFGSPTVWLRLTFGQHHKSNNVNH